MALGIALSVEANLGLSPISCMPYIFSLQFLPSFGILTVLLNAVFVLMQIAILRKKYHWIQLIQLPAVFIFGYFIDLCLVLASGLNVPSYAWQLFWCLLSCVVLAFGVFLQVHSKLTYLPGEGLVVVIADTVQKEFGKVKIVFDSTLVVLGIISSLVLTEQLVGVREGTVISALSVGFLVRFFKNKLPFIDAWLGYKPKTRS